MATEALENLARIGQLKVEPRNKIEIDRLISIAKTRLADARVLHLSSEGRFISAYSAGHAAHWLLCVGTVTEVKQLIF
jgi:hypothetical protein